MSMSSPAFDEARRLAVLDAYGILDTPVEKSFDDVVRLLSQLLDVPIAAVNLIAKGRQWFKSEIGLGTREMPLDDSICKFALLQENQMVVCDTLEDARFNCNPLVTGEPGLRFYAGELLRTPEGIPLGTLCVLDLKPRPHGLSAEERLILETLAQQIMAQIELRKAIKEQQDLLVQQQAVQEELRRERDQSQRLLEGMDEGFLFLDRDYRVQQINAGGLRFETRPAADILGKSLWEAWPGLEQRPLAQHYARAMNERVPVNFEEHYVFPDGRAIWIDIRAYPADDGLAVFYRNITDRKEAETQLRQTAERLEFTLHASRIGTWDLDLLHGMAQRSITHARCFGYTALPENWNFDTFIQHVHPEDREYVTRGFHTALRDLEDWSFECRVIWPDQTVHWISAHGSIDDRNPDHLHMNGIVYEITERKHTEEALRRSQQQALLAASQAENERRRLSALLEAAPVGIIVADAAGALVHVNAENRKIWGDHLMPSNTGEYVEWKGWWADRSPRHGQALQPDDWAMSRALAGETAPRQILDIEPFGKDGDRRTILNCAAPIRGESEEIVGAVVAQMDITDRIKAEEALRQADQRKDEFLAMLAHELRNPLAPITSAATLLAGHKIDEETVRRASAIIARQTRHMTGLIDDLLDVSRVTRGKVELENVELDMKDIIADAIEQVRPLIEKHKHRLTVQLSPVSSHVVGDRKRLVQVMANLLGNAAKYTPNGGNIEVSLESDVETVTITVRDDGIGMTPELIGSAFELFAQGERGLDRSQGGLGVGLALVRSLLQLHGGSVTAKSEGLGKGSTFEVTLPNASLQLGAPGTVNQDGDRKRGLALRVAIVDDNEDAGATLALLLETLGHQVSVVHSARNALESFPHFKPDVCLLDIGLPEMNGFDLARALRSKPETSAAVLIAVTGYAQEKDRHDAWAAGFDELFAKPVDIVALNLALARIAPTDRVGHKR